MLRVPAEHYLDPERWAREVAMFRRIPLMLALGGELRDARLVQGDDRDGHAGAAHPRHRRGGPRLPQLVQPSRRGGDGRRARHRPALRLPVPRLDLRHEGRPRRRHRPRVLRRHRHELPRPHTPPGGRARRADLRRAHARRGDGHRRAPVRLRPGPRLLRLRRLAPGLAAGDRPARTGRSPTTATSTSTTCRSCTGTASARTSATRRSTTLGSAPAGDVTRPGAARAPATCPRTSGTSTRICGGVWTIFPHVSFAGGNGGGLISQLFPGTDARRRRSPIQNYFVAAEPSDERAAEALRRGRLPRARRARRGLLHRPAAAAGPRHRRQGVRAVRPQRGRRPALPHAARPLRRRRARQPRAESVVLGVASARRSGSSGHGA